MDQSSARLLSKALIICSPRSSSIQLVALYKLHNKFPILLQFADLKTILIIKKSDNFETLQTMSPISHFIHTVSSPRNESNIYLANVILFACQYLWSIAFFFFWNADQVRQHHILNKQIVLSSEITLSYFNKSKLIYTSV